MVRNILITIIILFSFIKLHAQEIKSEVYEGKMIDKMPITLYLQLQENDCNADIIYYGMYKYNGKNDWLQLRITKNDKMQFVLVEYNFTGVMILTKTINGLEGIWISPDSKKQLKVELQKVEVTDEKIKEYEDQFEMENYANNDC